VPQRLGHCFDVLIPALKLLAASVSQEQMFLDRCGTALAHATERLEFRDHRHQCGWAPLLVPTSSMGQSAREQQDPVITSRHHQRRICIARTATRSAAPRYSRQAGTAH